MQFTSRLGKCKCFGGDSHPQEDASNKYWYGLPVKFLNCGSISDSCMIGLLVLLCAVTERVGNVNRSIRLFILIAERQRVAQFRRTYTA